MTPEQRLLIRRLSAEDFAEIIYLEDDVITGGNIETNKLRSQQR